MTVGDIGNIMYEFFLLTMKLSAPILLISMAVGVVIAVFQAATQVHEQTLTFVPKLLVISLVLVGGGGRMMEWIQDFIYEIFSLM